MLSRSIDLTNSWQSGKPTAGDPEEIQYTVTRNHQIPPCHLRRPFTSPAERMDEGRATRFYAASA